MARLEAEGVQAVPRLVRIQDRPAARADLAPPQMVLLVLAEIMIIVTETVAARAVAAQVALRVLPMTAASATEESIREQVLGLGPHLSGQNGGVQVQALAAWAPGGKKRITKLPGEKEAHVLVKTDSLQGQVVERARGLFQRASFF